MSGKVVVVVGGQFGSEAKGHVAGFLAADMAQLAMSQGRSTPMLVRAAGPNAGHTIYDEAGNRFPLRQLPTGVVTSPRSRIGIAAGAEIDEEVLKDEIRNLEKHGHFVDGRLLIDASATIIEQQHKDAEAGAGQDHGSLVTRIGSTGKGIGAARADRIMRNASTWGGADDVAGSIRQHLHNGADVLIEGTQGYGLGLHAGFYPYCTSSDCRAIDFMAMCGISPWAPYVSGVEVWVVVRTYPIRVAGNSGPLYGELDWEEVGRRSEGRAQPEHTTVTQKVRRVGGWDDQLVLDAIAANGSNVKVALMMADYVWPKIADMHGNFYDQVGEDSEIEKQLRYRESVLHSPIKIVGTGPRSLLRR